jgi:hypothetical protein
MRFSVSSFLRASKNPRNKTPAAQTTPMVGQTCEKTDIHPPEKVFDSFGIVSRQS